MKNLLCRVVGHRTVCSQQAVLLPDGGALFYHQHACMRCRGIRTWPTEWLGKEEEMNLRQALTPERVPVTVDLDYSYAHREALVH